ncbi:MAG: glycosyltransferase [Phycisphaeraceae bacterium]|nr:glycosyltransferase [Phycisphaeraceae bacterium]
MPQSDPATPRVAFIIPCFNHGRFVEEAVRSCLAQDGVETRVVVVDDGSDDGSTPAACDRCREIDPARVLVLHQANAGLPAARNAGAQAAAEFAAGFEFVSFLDADDWVEPAFSRKLCAPLRAADPSHTSHAYCQETLVGLGSGVWRVPEWDPLLLLVTNLHPVTCIVRRKCFDEVGGFDETMRRGYEDWDLWLRFAERGWRGVRVPEPLFTWRRHSAETMIADAVSRHDELYGALVARHRALFDAHAVEVIRLANGLLRSGDAHWVDEDRRSILLTQLRAHVQDVYHECYALREQSSRDRESREAAERALADEIANTARVRAGYESKPALRLSRKLHGAVDALPRPLAAPLRSLLRAARRLAG